ncbi:energy transducer TonB [Mucilaginibacter aquaedulcis]|uniref:energy transducer TonB n=1 Tax=Mucilaginibacter aquaedulcis TaxID=1187081 RepID=UPI0025B5850E|nr:TonB family protein [Mucilaginibacter aquaedulcis]MDN3550628.1 TonB family protein [Mucilaginibacter aquaedulcis]
MFILAFVLTATALTALAQPAFKGGDQAFATFLKNNIVYPEYSSRNCISGIIDVSFRITKNGKVVDATVQRGLGIDLDEEALRIIKLTSGKWIVPDDYNENTRLVQPVRFSPDQTNCGSSPNAADIQAAITSYKIRQELENAVTNYYSNKYQGKADTSKEATIINLKKQLGFDDELIGDLLQQANKKLKQGDQEGACTDWTFIRNIGSNRADSFISKYCKH